jgi:hypothetical protein
MAHPASPTKLVGSGKCVPLLRFCCERELNRIRYNGYRYHVRQLQRIAACEKA